MNAAMTAATAPALVTIYCQDWMHVDVFENIYDKTDVYSQTEHNIHWLKAGGSPAEFPLIRYMQMYKGLQERNRNYTLPVLCKHAKHDRRSSELNVVHITKDDVLQIYLTSLFQGSAGPLVVIDTRQVIAKENRTLLLEVHMVVAPHQTLPQSFDYAVNQIKEAFCRRYMRPEYCFPQSRHAAVQWKEGLFGFICIG